MDCQDITLCKPTCGPEMSEAAEARCPQYAAVKGALEDKLTRTGLSQETQVRLDAARASLEEKRRRFIRAKILHDVITDLSVDPSCPLGADLASKLTASQLAECLDQGRREGVEQGRQEEMVSTLGLSLAEIPRPSLSPQLQKALREGVEDHLFENTKSLFQIVNQDHEMETRRSILHPHLARLHDRVADLVALDQQSEKEMKSLNINLSQAISEQTRVLNQLVDSLDTLVNKHYTGTKLEATSVQAQHMRTKCELIRLKLRNLELEIVNSTYTKEAVKAIRVVRDQLLARLSRGESELSALENTISQYRDVGPEFGDLVAQYSSILKQIQDKKWALQELTGAAL